MLEIKEFQTYLATLGYVDGTQKMLPICLEEFFFFIPKTVALVEPEDILKYYEYLQNRPNKRRPGGLSENYIHHHLYSLKLFFGWQQQKGKIVENPISGLEFPSSSSKRREILSLEEVKLLYAGCKTWLERAVLGLYYGCGLRRSEGEQLDLKDVHFRSDVLYVRAGKNNKRRVVPLSKTVKEDLYQYAYFARKNRPNETAFLCNKRGTRMSGNSSNNLLRKLLVRSEIKREISLHSLRHSVATHLLSKGLSVEYVRDFLGHKSLESTHLYTHVKDRQLWSLSSI